MIKSSHAFFAVPLFAALASCTVVSVADGGGKNTVREIPVRDFNAIEISAGARVTYIREEGPCTARVTLPEDAARAAEVYVEDGTLHVEFKPHARTVYRKNRYLYDVVATSSSLNRITNFGTARVKIEDGLETGNLLLESYGTADFVCGDLKCGTLTVKASGTGDVTAGDVTAGDVSVLASGSGRIYLAGVRTGVLDVESSGAGDVGIGSVTADSVSVFANGAGDTNLGDVRAGTVLAELSGSGDVTMSGSAGNARFSTSGSGDIRCRKFEASRAEAYTSGFGDIYLGAAGSVDSGSTGPGEVYCNGKPVAGSSARESVRTAE